MHVSDGQAVVDVVYLGTSENPKDKALVDQIKIHLSQVSGGLIKPWHLSEISPGSDVQQEINFALSRADVILVLISPNMTISEEIKQIVLERLHKNAVRVIPILLRPFGWQSGAFGKLQPLPQNRIPIGNSSSYKRDEVLQEVAQSIMNVAQEISTRKRTPRPIDTVDIDMLTGTVQLQIMQWSQVQPIVSSNATFLVNQTFHNKDDFFARQSECRDLFENCKGGGATSIIGPRGIGKTWLMKYLELETPNQLGALYRIGYVNAALSDNHISVSNFIIAMLESLGVRVTPSLTSLQRIESYAVFTRAIKQLVANHFYPILCIDEFEELHPHRGFDVQFFRMLRPLCQGEGLSLVTASKKTLRELSEEHKLSDDVTSGLYNIVETVPLKPFTLQEAQEFFAKKLGVSQEAQNLLLEASMQRSTHSWPPLSLQIAGKLFLEEVKIGGQNTNESYWQGFRERVQAKYRASGGQI